MNAQTIINEIVKQVAAHVEQRAGEPEMPNSPAPWRGYEEEARAFIASTEDGEGWTIQRYGGLGSVVETRNIHLDAAERERVAKSAVRLAAFPPYR